MSLCADPLLFILQISVFCYESCQSARLFYVKRAAVELRWTCLSETVEHGYVIIGFYACVQSLADNVIFSLSWPIFLCVYSLIIYPRKDQSGISFYPRRRNVFPSDTISLKVWTTPGISTRVSPRSIPCRFYFFFYLPWSCIWVTKFFMEKKIGNIWSFLALVLPTFSVI